MAKQVQTRYRGLKYINDQGGIQADREEDGVTIYLDQNHVDYRAAITGAFGPVAPLEKAE